MSTLATITPHSRIWIYQSNKTLDTEVQGKIRDQAKVFLDAWTSHGSTMDAVIEILYNRFIVIAVDEQTAPASGCGVDKSVRFIQDLEKGYGITLLDRMQVAWEENGGVHGASLREFETLLNSGKLGGETLVFNNLVNTKEEMEKNWRIPLKSSWHARLMPKSPQKS
jgi:hypothetical protein